MENKGFSVGDLIKSSWRIMRQNLGFFIIFIILAGITLCIPYALSHKFEKTSALYSWVLFVIYYALSLVVSLGFVKISLEFSAHQPAKFSDLFRCFPQILNFFIAKLLYDILLIVGLVLLVFPMVIWGLRYGMFYYFIVDKNVGPIEALQLSAKTTMGAKWDLLALSCICLIINLLGVMCLGFGLLATIPTTLIAQAMAYRTLLLQTEKNAAPKLIVEERL